MSILICEYLYINVILEYQNCCAVSVKNVLCDIKFSCSRYSWSSNVSYIIFREKGTMSVHLYYNYRYEWSFVWFFILVVVDFELTRIFAYRSSVESVLKSKEVHYM